MISITKLINEMPKYTKDIKMYSDYLKNEKVIIKKDKFIWKGKEYELTYDGYNWQVENDYNNTSKSKLSAIFWYIKNRK